MAMNKKQIQALVSTIPSAAPTALAPLRTQLEAQHGGYVGEDKYEVRGLILAGIQEIEGRQQAQALGAKPDAAPVVVQQVVRGPQVVTEESVTIVGDADAILGDDGGDET